MTKSIDITSIIHLGKYRTDYAARRCYMCRKRLTPEDDVYMVNMRCRPTALICGECEIEVSE